MATEPRKKRYRDPVDEDPGEQLNLDPNLQNVQTVVELHSHQAHEVKHPLRLIQWLTGQLGRPAAFYSLLTGMLLWIAYNSLAPRLGFRCLDQPPFFWLQGIVAMAALLISSMVLITQNRQGKLAARRALLDLHVNLLSEQKVAKVISLLEELRRDIPSVGNRVDAQAEAMSRPVDAQAVITNLEQRVEQAIAGRLSPAEAAAELEIAAAVTAER